MSHFLVFCFACWIPCSFDCRAPDVHQSQPLADVTEQKWTAVLKLGSQLPMPLTRKYEQVSEWVAKKAENRKVTKKEKFRNCVKSYFLLCFIHQTNSTKGFLTHTKYRIKVEVGTVMTWTVILSIFVLDTVKNKKFVSEDTIPDWQEVKSNCDQKHYYFNHPPFM